MSHHRGSDATARLEDEVGAFRVWADEYTAGRSAPGGEWECDYPDWTRAYAAIDDYLRSGALTSASAASLGNLLYLLARDNECESVAGSIAALQPLECLLFLADQSVALGEPQARWQLAVRLGDVTTSGAARARVEAVLLAFMRDEDEYVRRRTLQALASQASASTEQLALAAWEEEHDSQQWTRMNALEVLRRVGSARLPELLKEAASDPRTHLSLFARNMLAGKPGWSPGSTS